MLETWVITCEHRFWYSRQRASTRISFQILLYIGITDNKLHIRGSKDIYSGEIVNFGNGKQVMEEIGISESAIRYDYEPVMLSKLNSMLGSIRALPINEYIVMFDNNSKDILVTKPV